MVGGEGGFRKLERKRGEASGGKGGFKGVRVGIEIRRIRVLESEYHLNNHFSQKLLFLGYPHRFLPPGYIPRAPMSAHRFTTRHEECIYRFNIYPTPSHHT